MLYHTVELIIQASSNFHFIFCFCNLIILSVLIASSRSSPAEYNLETSNALLVRVDDHDLGEDEHNSVKSEPSFDSQDSIPTNEGTLDNHKMTSQEAAGDNDGEASTFDEQGKPCADSTEVGSNSKEIRMYAALSPIDGNVKAALEDQKQNQQQEEEEEGDDDELRRKIEDFIDMVNREWREEKLSYLHAINFD